MREADEVWSRGEAPSGFPGGLGSQFIEILTGDPLVMKQPFGQSSRPSFDQLLDVPMRQRPRIVPMLTLSAARIKRRQSPQMHRPGDRVWLVGAAVFGSLDGIARHGNSDSSARDSPRRHGEHGAEQYSRAKIPMTSRSAAGANLIKRLTKPMLGLAHVHRNKMIHQDQPDGISHPVKLLSAEEYVIVSRRLPGIQPFLCHGNLDHPVHPFEYFRQLAACVFAGSQLLEGKIRFELLRPILGFAVLPTPTSLTAPGVEMADQVKRLRFPWMVQSLDRLGHTLSYQPYSGHLVERPRMAVK